MPSILVLSAMPQSHDHLPGVDREVQMIRKILEESLSSFEVRVQASAGLKDFRRGLLAFRPDFVHFCGHGSEDGIVLEDDEGHPYIVRGLELAHSFRSLPGVTKCVFLNADNTAAIAENIALSVDYVIAQRRPVSDSAAADFAQYFYEQIGVGKSVEYAFEGARLRIKLNADSELHPVLVSSAQATGSPQDSFRLALLEPDLVLALNTNPDLMHQLHWRNFEKLLAQLLERLGYEIELQRGTKDGGVDVFALKRQGIFGSERYLVQAKRWSKPVGVEPVREVMFLHSHHRMTKSCLASTSRFTRGAWSLAKEYQWQLELRDSEKLREWIELAAGVP